MGMGTGAATAGEDAVLRLIGRQKAEFDRAAGLRSAVLGVQVVIAILAAASIFIVDEKWLYLAAFVGVGLAVAWVFLWWQQNQSLSHAERLRRATLIAGGLDVKLDGDELFDLANGGAASDAEAERRIDPDYFASKLPVGPGRLSEMTEESAIWTKTLAKYAGRETWGLFAFLTAVTVIFLFSSVIFLPLQSWALVARVFFAMLVVVLSTDLLGAAIAYTRASGDVAQIVQRLRRHRHAGNSLEGLMVILGDYNAIVETMPVFPKGLYPRHQERLNRDYKLYLTGAQ